MSSSTGYAAVAFANVQLATTSAPTEKGAGATTKTHRPTATQDEEERKSVNASDSGGGGGGGGGGSSSSFTAVAYRQQTQQSSSTSSYLQQPQQQQQQHQYHGCSCCGQQQPCECSDSQGPTRKSSSCSYEFQPIGHPQHYHMGNNTSNSNCNNDNNNNIAQSQPPYADQGQPERFNNHYQLQQQLSSPSRRELQISGGGGDTGGLLVVAPNPHHHQLGYTNSTSSNYTETNEVCWTFAPSSDGDHPSNPRVTFKTEQQQQLVGYGYEFYSELQSDTKIGSFEADANDFNNNNQQQLHHQQSQPHFSAPAHNAPNGPLRPTINQDPVPHYHYQAHSAASNQARQQFATSSSNFYPIAAPSGGGAAAASDCNQTSDYDCRRQAQDHFQQSADSFNAQARHQTLRNLNSHGHDAHHDQQQQQLLQAQNSGSISDSEAGRQFQEVQQGQDCSNYGQIITQQQMPAVLHRSSLQEQPNQTRPGEPDRVRREIIQYGYRQDHHHHHHQENDQAPEHQHPLYQHSQQVATIEQDQTTTGGELYPRNGFAESQQPTLNCDNNYANQISATTTPSLATTDDGSEPIVRIPNSNKLRSLKGRRGRPRKKSARSKNKVNGKLWEFIRDLLLNEHTNPSFIRWERREDGIFKFVQSDKVAKMWGERKQNPKMTYEKLSRAMRYYYKSKVLLPVFGRRLVYKFGPNATGWMPDMKDNVF